MDLDLKTLAYEDAASSTTPPMVHTDLVRPAVTFYLLSEFVKAGKALDLYLKKPFVYGADRVQDEDIYGDLADIDAPRLLDQREREFAHGVVGLATESAETVELLMKVWFFNEHVEAGKVIDEAGDNLWYIVRMLRALGSDLPSAMRANVAKLTERHHKNGATFNPNADRDRDRQAESAAQAEAALERAEPERAASVFYPTSGAPLAVNGVGGPMRDATDEEMRTLPPNEASFVTGRLTPASTAKGISRVEWLDNGQEVWVDSYAGGAAPGGAFSTLGLRFFADADDGTGKTRLYIATDLLGSGITVTAGELSVTALDVETLRRLGIGGPDGAPFPSPREVIQDEGTPYPKGVTE